MVSSPRRHTASAALLSLGVAAALVSPGIGQAGGGPPGGGGGAPGATIAVQSRGFAVTIPAQLTAGYTTLSFVRNGGIWNSAGIGRLKPGTTEAQVTAALTSGDQAATAQEMVLLGAIGRGRLTVNGTPGRYVVFDVEEGAGKKVMAAYRFFAIVTGLGLVSPPRPNVTVRMVDFRFIMPSAIPSGMDTFRVRNAGTQPHEMALFKLAPGKSARDVAAYLQKRQGPPPGSFVGGVFDMSPEVTNWLTQRIAPGSYVALCLITDPRTDKSHAALGMMMPFVARPMEPTTGQ